MKKSIIALSLLVAGLCSCNSDEELVKKNPGYMEDGYAGLTIRMDFPSAATKAVGDTLTGTSSVSYAEEREISSVAFFVKTGDDNSDGTLKPGAFGKYFSTEDLLSANGLNEPLAKVAEGEYTATIKIKSEGWGGNTKVIVIANYAENGLTDKLKAVLTWDALKEIQSNELTSNPTTPLLMYGTKEVEMVSGDTKGVEFTMDRLVARVDILNKASNLGDASKGFVLTSAQFVNPKQYTYLLPYHERLNAIPVVTTDFTAHIPDAGSPLKIDSLYTYENTNDEGTSALTAIRVNGTFNGAPVSKVIDFRRMNSAGAPTDSIGLARNNRYLININPTPDSTDVEWTVKVAEWEVADTIRIQPSTKVPDINGLPESGALVAGATWDKGSKTITLAETYAGGAVLEFTAACSQSPGFKVDFAYNTTGSSFGLDQEANLTAFVQQGPPVVTYAAAVTRKYTVTIPAQTVKVPADVYVRIVNSASDNACDTIRIISRPDYNALSGLKPVLMLDGKFWAPVNVGATAMPTTVPATANTDITTTCGQFFQWGRKVGFRATNDPTVCAGDTANVARVGWPAQSNLADMETTAGWQDKFIIEGSTAKHGVNTQRNWLRINPDGDNPAGAEMQNAWYQLLWDAAATMGSKKTTATKTTTDPCPVGWRVPTIGDWEAIGAGRTAVIKEWDATAKLMKITGAVDTDKLVLPAAGYRNYDTGASYGQGINGNYWSSSVPSGNVSASYVDFNSAVLNSNTNCRAYGFSVRCVQE